MDRETKTDRQREEGTEGGRKGMREGGTETDIQR